MDGPELRALEPLMAPWDPAAWEAVKLELGPGAGVQLDLLDQAPDAAAGS